MSQVKKTVKELCNEFITVAVFVILLGTVVMAILFFTKKEWVIPFLYGYSAFVVIVIITAQKFGGTLWNFVFRVKK